MNSVKNSSLDTLAVAAISSGIPIMVTLKDKWYVGLILILVGAGLSYLKYKLRD